MKIERVELHAIELPLIHPFETSFGCETTHPCILVATSSEGVTGWGECSAMATPAYSYETLETAWHILRDFLVPAILGHEIESPDDVVSRFTHIRGHPMARAALENSIWDLLARAHGISLAHMLGSTRHEIAVGVSVGVEASLDALLDRVAGFIAQGYGRIKLKIKPGWDVGPVQAVREQWPDVMLQVDANCAYTLDDMLVFKQLDELGLALIEQPLHHDDIVDHALLQTQVQTPLCLDESIQSLHHARWALDIDACRVINIKVGRVGGLTAALHIHNLCQERGVPVWCGGMLETNVGRALNVALASLPNFTLPGDISATSRYYDEDIATPDFILHGGSFLAVPTASGIGVDIVPDQLKAFRTRRMALT
jgi:O-succinylbenzoate synthase